MTATIPNMAVLSLDSARVIIGLTRIKENYTKTLKVVTKPQSTKEHGLLEDKEESRIIDLLRQAELRFTINGWISTGLTTRAGLGSKDENGNDITDPVLIKETMKKIFFAGDLFTITIHGTDYEVNSDKFEVDWQAEDSDTIRGYDVMFTVVSTKKW
jgi:hypothetical protein